MPLLELMGVGNLPSWRSLRNVYEVIWCFVTRDLMIFHAKPAKPALSNVEEQSIWLRYRRFFA